MSKKRSRSSHLTETRVFGEHTTYQVVASETNVEREWLANVPECPQLAQHHISHAGVMCGHEPLEIVRRQLSGSFILACFEGEGQVLCDGKWETIRAGQACMQPPFMLNALKASPGTEWKFCWVRYLEDPECQPIVSTQSPVISHYDAGPLRHAILGLIAEVGAGSPPAMHLPWIEILGQHIRELTQPYQSDDRLWKLWNDVQQDLAQDWTLTALAHTAHLSEEHLRRLCKKQLGRSPIRHLTMMRMQHACHLLGSTEMKIDEVARKVGYAGGFHFSNVFTSWTGWRPSDYRSRSK